MNASGTSSGSIFLAFALSGNEAGTDAIGSGSDAVLGWIGNGTTSVSSGTLTNDGGSEFGITGMDFAYKQALGGATVNFTIEGKKDGATVGTIVLTTPTHNSAIAIDFTTPTTGSFADIDELVITPASPLFGGFSVDDMVIVDAVVSSGSLKRSTVTFTELSQSTTVIEGDSGTSAEFASGSSRYDIDAGKITLRGPDGNQTLTVDTFTFTFSR